MEERPAKAPGTRGAAANWACLSCALWWLLLGAGGARGLGVRVEAQTAGLPPGTRWTPQGMKSPSVHGGCPLAPPSRSPRGRGQHGADLWRPDPLRSPRSSLRISRALPLASQSVLSYEAATTDVNRYQLASCKWKEGLSFRVRARAPPPALRTRPGAQVVKSAPAPLGAGPAAAGLRAACCPWRTPVAPRHPAGPRGAGADCLGAPQLPPTPRKGRDRDQASPGHGGS